MENTTVESQADETTQSQAGETQTEQTNTEPEAISLDAAKKLRSENKTLRERAKEAEEKNAAYESEKLTATEKIEKKLTDATATIGKRDEGLKGLLLEREISRLKDTVGLRATKSISRLIDADAIEFDLDGLKVGGVENELKRLKKEDPGLFVTGGTDGGAGGTGRQAASEDMNDIIRRRMNKN